MGKSRWALLLFVVLGGLLGSILGEAVRALTPPGMIQRIFAEPITVGLNPPLSLDLKLFTITFGLTLDLNLLTVLGIFLGLYLYRNI